MENKNLIVISKGCLVWLCILMCLVSGAIALCVAYFCTTYKFSMSHMSTDAFIGAIATLMGILITFVLGFQIINALEINKKLHQFEESVEKKNREHISDIDKKSKNLKSELVSKINDNKESIDKRIKSIEKRTESSINNIDVNFNQLSELGYRLEVESLDTRRKLLLNIYARETKLETKIKYLINCILILGAYNMLVKRVSSLNTNWSSMNKHIDRLEKHYMELIMNTTINVSSDPISNLKNRISIFLKKYKVFSAPYSKCINILFYIIEQKEEGLEIETLKTNVEIRMELYKQELEEYISKN